ncbi:VQ motif-containing protein [Actinidia rufa]|uniref:VQ motif-containing protein n=1 Tax=Actinidia rufa TaxID=165716 RepID=A0A7J0FQH6_9ERIC|nr:VQ motif-containing protein [Actinidia rufa]
MKPHPNTTIPATPKLVMHKDSRVISKFKPKIRIIHMVAPEIIKTDVAHFQELVQRLTGKKAERKHDIESTSRDPTKELASSCPETSKNAQSESCINILHNIGDGKKKEFTEREDIWGGVNSNSFIGGFGDMEGLVHDLTEFPLLPLKSSHFNRYGGMPLCQ